MNEFELAIKSYSQAIEINPSYAKAYANRGIIYRLKIRDKDKGCSDLKTACYYNDCKAYNISIKNNLCD